MCEGTWAQKKMGLSDRSFALRMTSSFFLMLGVFLKRWIFWHIYLGMDLIWSWEG
jgi:hypothetical protein